MQAHTTKPEKIFIGLSGGVDSSVSAALLKERGHEVTGVYIKPWQPDFVACTWREERHDAMRVAAMLDIPFETLDLSDLYKKEVAEYMIDEYQRGRTPNPDILCNREVKFGAFWDWAQSNGADAIATGHYARIDKSIREIRNPNLRPTTYNLLAGVDNKKDQSYFLWTLTEDDLSHIHFPIGEFQKDEVREMAAAFDLPTAEKKDSQGVCFLGEVDMKEFLAHYIEVEEGAVLNTKGEVIGSHDGAVLYTLGERRGFRVQAVAPDQKPLFVIGKDLQKNTITVAEKDADGVLPGADRTVELEKVNWISAVPDSEKSYTARFRYRQQLEACSVVCGTDTATVIFDEPQSSVAKGQSVVVYDGEVCLGGGVIA